MNSSSPQDGAALDCTFAQLLTLAKTPNARLTNRDNAALSAALDGAGGMKPVLDHVRATRLQALATCLGEQRMAKIMPWLQELTGLTFLGAFMGATDCLAVEDSKLHLVDGKGQALSPDDLVVHSQAVVRRIQDYLGEETINQVGPLIDELCGCSYMDAAVQVAGAA